MKTIAIAAAVLMLAGCAHVPQVNRAAKADKYTAPKAAKIAQPAPTFKQRWFPKYKIKWLHPK